jgi:hypothetical protein
MNEIHFIINCATLCQENNFSGYVYIVIGHHVNSVNPFLTLRSVLRFEKSICYVQPLDRKFMIAAFDVEKLKLKIFKVSVRNHCPKDCVVLLAIFKLAVCDMIKKNKKLRSNIQYFFLC